MPKLYLIPTHLGTTNYETLFPAYNLEVIQSLTTYIVENTRTARRFISSLNLGIDISLLQFYELNKHTQEDEVSYFSQLLLKQDVGLISEAGTPCVADPGNKAVMIAHRNKIEVVSLIGPSSILLALMASGLNGQSFAFNGYLPIDKSERIKALQHLERISRTQGQTQIFMETPYRNDKLFHDILQHCQSSTLLCIAADITGENQFVFTQTIAEWKKDKKPEINKVPTIFLLQSF